MPEISAGWGPPITLGPQRPAGGAGTSLFANKYRPLPAGRGFFVSVVAVEGLRPRWSRAASHRCLSVPVFFTRQAGAAPIPYIGNKIIHRRDQQDQRDDQRDDSGHIHLEFIKRRSAKTLPIVMNVSIISGQGK